MGSGIGIVIGIPHKSQEPDHKPEQPESWGLDKYDVLNQMADSFRKEKDAIGIHLCAIVYEEMRAADLGQRECRCLGRFYLAMAYNRTVDGADRELVHILMPEIQGLMREAEHHAQLARLKAEVADVELDEPGV